MMDFAQDFAQNVERCVARVRAPEPQRCGTLVRLVGLRMEARGIMAPIGTCCELTSGNGHRVEAEVVGFQDKTLFLMPFTEPVGIGPGATVRAMPDSGSVSLGPELLGRVIDGRGHAIDGKPQPQCATRLSLLGLPINPMERGPIHKILDVGVKAINGLLTIGRGQRIGLVAGSGVGKSVLLGMLTRFTEADVVVIGLVGERGREVQAFIQRNPGSEEGLAKAVVVAAPGQRVTRAPAQGRANDAPGGRVLQGPRQRRVDVGRQPHPCGPRPARNWLGRWRAAHRQGLPAVGVCASAQLD